MISKKDLISFLNVGYFLSYSDFNYTFNLSKINKKMYLELSFEELIDLSFNYLMKSIENLFENNKQHVVPLSGGLDSRAILAGLSEFTESRNIYTYTFGTPNTLDYEIGNNIAKVIGTKHKKFPLTDYQYSIDELLDISKRVHHQTVLFHHAPIWKLDELYSDSLIWSGHFGDPLTGSHYIPNAPKSEEEIKRLYLKVNSYQKNIQLTPQNLDILYDDICFIKNEFVSDMELLDFYNRQLKFIEPHVLISGFNYKLPFLDDDLFSFFLSIDNKYRKNQLLYKKMLVKRFPTLFSFPVKNYYGLPLNASKLQILNKKIKNKINRKITKFNNSINYLDFDTKIREDQNFNFIIKQSIYDLHARSIIDWLDIRNIYLEHINKNGDYGKALILLTSLEIHLKAKSL